MRKPTQREALQKALQKSLEKADRKALAEVAEVLTEGCTYSDERDELLVIMSDAGIASIAFRSEQLRATAERDAKRATHLNGVATRNEIDASSGAVASGAPKDGGRAEHR